MSTYQYRDSPYKDKRVLQPYYFCNEHSHNRYKRLCSEAGALFYSVDVMLCATSHCVGLYHNGAGFSFSVSMDRLSRYGASHVKYKTDMRPSYIYNCNSYSGKVMSFYLIDPLIVCNLFVTDKLIGTVRLALKTFISTLCLP